MSTFKAANYDELVNGQVYIGDLEVDQPIRYSRAIRFWPQGVASGSLATGTVSVDNRDGKFDYLITESSRDKLIEVKRDGVVLLTGIIDDITALDDATIQFRIKDVLSRLDRPLQLRTYGNEADESVRERVLPILLGIGRNIRPTLYKAVDPSLGPAYRIHDFSLSGVVNVRDSGLELDPATQWDFDQRIGNSGIVIDVEPAGVLTCDASNPGQDAYGTTDELSGNGELSTSFTGSTGFRSTDSSPFPAANLPTGWGRVRTAVDEGGGANPYQLTFENPGLRMSNPDSSAAFCWIYTADGSGNITTPFESGKVYRLRFEVDQLIGGGDRQQRGRFRIRLSGSERIVFDLQAQRGPVAGNSFVVDFVVSESANQGLILALEGFGPEVVIKDLEAFEADAPSKSQLTGITLASYMEEVVFRAAESVTKIDSDGIDDIAGSDPALLGYYTEDPVTALSVMRKALQSYTADIYSGRDGQIKFAQLRDPAGDVARFKIDPERLLAPPSVRVDTAPGLTSQIRARKNQHQFRNADFADNITAVPLELRQSFIQPSQFVAQAAIPENWPTIYTHAIDAEPLDSVFDNRSDAALEIQRVVNLYSEPRLIVDVEVGLDPDEFIEPNDVVLLQYPRYGFNDGVNFLVIGVEDVITGKQGLRTARLTLWGSSGKNFDPIVPPAPPAAFAYLLTEAGLELLTEDNKLIEVE